MNYLIKFNKKCLLDHIYYKESKQFDFWVCGTYKKDKEKGFTKWKKYLDCVANIDFLNLNNNKWKELKYFNSINQRQILPHEIVLDIEEPNQLPKIIKTLKKWKWDFNLFETGSRGYYIHLFFNRNLNTNEKESIILRFETDIQKCSDKTLIVLEGCNHWKSGKLKRIIKV